MSTYHTKVDTSLSEHGRYPPGSWYLTIDTESGWVPGLPEGHFALFFREGATKADAERLQDLFDRMVTTLAFTPHDPPSGRGIGQAGSGG